MAAPGSKVEWKDFHGYDVHDIDSLAEARWDLYGERILAAEYSKNGAWHRFTADELATIQAFRDNPNYP